jgi:hypothetical protein
LSSSAGSGVFSGIASPGLAKTSYFSPVISRSCSCEEASERLAAITAAAALSRAAFASCTSVMAIRPTSKRFSACSSCRAIASSAEDCASTVSWAASTLKYAVLTREIRPCSSAW